MRNIKVKQILLLAFGILICTIMTSCPNLTPGMGSIVDIDGPELTVSRMVVKAIKEGDPDSEKNDFSNVTYCGRNIVLYGDANDNVGVTDVYAEVKWSGEDNYKFLKSASISGEKWELPLNLDGEGACWLKIIATDKEGNYQSKSYRLISLYVDDTPPVAKDWYIDRLVNGIQYNLSSKADLETIIAKDPGLTEVTNVDVAQNDEFLICATLSDATGIDKSYIRLYDEDGNALHDDYIASESDSASVYSPKFKINRTKIPGLPTNGMHYIQVRYSSEDLVTDPGHNEVKDKQFETSWFIWWPESDNPKCYLQNLNDNKLMMHVGDSISLKVFDDDAFKNGTQVVCTLKDENNTVVYTDTYNVSTNNNREVTLGVTAPATPQDLNLTVKAEDKGGNKLNKTITVSVVDDSLPSLIITSPENNQIPSVVGATAVTSFTGMALDKAGSTYLEFVWVPYKSNATEYSSLKAKAKSWLDSLDTDAKHNALKPAGDYKITEGEGEYAGLKLISAKLTEAGKVSDFTKHTFNFTLSIKNDFPETDWVLDKYFLVRLTRKDGKFIDQELTLSADNLKPEIETIVPSGNMAILDTDTNYVFKFRGVKSSGLPMDPAGYHLYYVHKNGDLTEYNKDTIDSEGYFISETISKETIQAIQAGNDTPKCKIVVKDIFGNTNEVIYQFVIDSLPQIQSVTSSAPGKCKVGDTIYINVSFSKVVNCTSSTYLKIKNIKNDVVSPTVKVSDDLKAVYESGSGSTTLTFKYTVREGDTSDGLQVDNVGNAPIVGMDSSQVHVETLNDSDNLQAKKTIKIDGISPKVESIKVVTDAESKNTVAGRTYLRAGRTITATVKVDSPVTIQGSPVIKLNNVDLSWKSISLDGKTLVFSKKIYGTDTNGNLSYSTTSDFDKICDSFGNTVVFADDMTTDIPDMTIDTVGFEKAPVVISSGKALISGKYKDSVKFTVSTISGAKTEYSIDGGKTWNLYSSEVELTNSATLVCRQTDYAGNVSPYSAHIVLDINSSFPDFTLECTNADGNYTLGEDGILEFKVNFSAPVYVNSYTAWIGISGKNTGDVISANAKAVIDVENMRGSGAVTEVKFKYELKEKDNFTLKVKKEDVHLDGIVDAYGISQKNTDTLENDYVRSDLKCDTVAPRVVEMTRGSVNAVTKRESNVITIKFNENVKVASGKIYLRQVDGWAIPPVFTAKDFTTVLNAVKKNGNVGTSSLTGTQVLYLDELEDSEWLFASSPSQANDRYHGTGQYAGPYKKTSQGLNADGSANTDTKYVLDYDVDIWDSSLSKKTKFGYTIDLSKNNNAQTNIKANTDSVSVNSTPFIKVDANGDIVHNANGSGTLKYPTITTDDIRNVLEKVHFHERYMDSASSYIDIQADGKTVVLTFPKGLLGDEELEAGREWELVIEKGAFIDETGNEFGAESDCSISKSDSIQIANNPSGTIAETTTWARKRTSVEDNDSIKPLVLLQYGSEASFMSAGVEKPYIRVDRYSYTIGAFQPISTEDAQDVPSKYVGQSNNYNPAPTALVRVRMDCQTKGATIRYNVASEDNDVTTDAAPAGGGDYHNTDNNTDCHSYYTKTTVSAPSAPTASSKNGEALQRIYTFGGNGDYEKSCKQIYVAKAFLNSSESTEIDTEGVFQTVLHLADPLRGDGESCSSNDTGHQDVSIRGTTGWAGEPSISPFPLRDSQVGSPFLKLCYRKTEIQNEKEVNTSDYYWVSYDVLVMASFSSYCANKDSKYDWGKNWGKIEPGEFTRCTGLRRWW